MEQTKGKWELHSYYDLSGVLTHGAISSNGKYICEEATEGDANLIASAPEMLKMLKKLHESCLNHRGKKRRKLGELIAKAEGGE